MIIVTLDVEFTGFDGRSELAVSKSKSDDFNGNPRFAMRVVRDLSAKVTEEVHRMLVSDLGDIDLQRSVFSGIFQTKNEKATLSEGMIALADGRTAPIECVNALAGLDGEWPGATLPQARAAVVCAVIEAYEKLKGENSNG